MQLGRNKRKSHRGSPQKDSFVWNIIKGIVRLLVLIVFLAGIYFVTRLDFFSISNVVVSGGETISHEEIVVLAERELQGTYFRLIPKRFIYLYPHDRIRELVQAVPRIHNLNIQRENRRSLSISFEEYLPHALLCLENSPDTPCFFMDEIGYAFAVAPQLQGGSLTRHIVPATLFQKGQIFSDQTLTAIDTFVTQSESAFGFRIKTVEHMQNGDIAFYVNGGGKILATLKKDLTKTTEDIVVILDSEEFSHIKPGNFQYIDARFDNKIFINEEIATSTGSTTETLSE